MHKVLTDRRKGRLVLLFVYLVAFSLGFSVSTVSYYPILLKSAIAGAVVVSIIYLGSIDFNNSSVFDPYWSVAPPMFTLYYIALAMSEQVLVISPRMVILLVLTLVYGARLTWNFLHGWPGLKHEDWRYVNFRKKTGKAYWVVSFAAIHMFPALMVFGGTLSIWVVVVKDYNSLNILDLVAAVVTAGAIVLEAISDRQLRNFIKKNRETGTTMSKGLWSISRHPNYLGEILFWWGLFLFALASDPAFWWVGIGPLAITLMFRFASIPMIEKRLMERRIDYREYRKNFPMLIPWKVFESRKPGVTD